MLRSRTCQPVSTAARACILLLEVDGRSQTASTYSIVPLIMAYHRVARVRVGVYGLARHVADRVVFSRRATLTPGRSCLMCIVTQFFCNAIFFVAVAVSARCRLVVHRDASTRVAHRIAPRANRDLSEACHPYQRCCLARSVHLHDAQDRSEVVAGWLVFAATGMGRGRLLGRGRNLRTRS